MIFNKLRLLFFTFFFLFISLFSLPTIEPFEGFGKTIQPTIIPTLPDSDSLGGPAFYWKKIYAREAYFDTVFANFGISTDTVLFSKFSGKTDTLGSFYWQEFAFRDSVDYHYFKTFTVSKSGALFEKIEDAINSLKDSEEDSINIIIFSNVIQNETIFINLDSLKFITLSSINFCDLEGLNFVVYGSGTIIFKDLKNFNLSAKCNTLKIYNSSLEIIDTLNAENLEIYNSSVSNSTISGDTFAIISGENSLGTIKNTLFYFGSNQKGLFFKNIQAFNINFSLNSSCALKFYNSYFFNCVLATAEYANFYIEQSEIYNSFLFAGEIYAKNSIFGNNFCFTQGSTEIEDCILNNGYYFTYCSTDPSIISKNSIISGLNFNQGGVNLKIIAPDQTIVTGCNFSNKSLSYDSYSSLFIESGASCISSNNRFGQSVIVQGNLKSFNDLYFGAGSDAIRINEGGKVEIHNSKIKSLENPAVLINNGGLKIYNCEISSDTSPVIKILSDYEFNDTLLLENSLISSNNSAINFTFLQLPENSLSIYLKNSEFKTKDLIQDDSVGKYKVFLDLNNVFKTTNEISILNFIKSSSIPPYFLSLKSDSIYTKKITGIKGSFTDTFYSPKLNCDTLIFSSGTKMYWNGSLINETAAFQATSLWGMSVYSNNLTNKDAATPISIRFNYSTDPTTSRWQFINYDNSADTSMYEKVSDTTIYINRKTSFRRFVSFSESIYSPKVKGIKGYFTDTLYSPKLNCDTLMFGGTARKMYWNGTLLNLANAAFQAASFLVGSTSGYVNSPNYYNYSAYPLRLYFNYLTNPTTSRWQIVNFDNSADTSMYEKVSDTTIYINRKTSFRRFVSFSESIYSPIFKTNSIKLNKLEFPNNYNLFYDSLTGFIFSNIYYVTLDPSNQPLYIGYDGIQFASPEFNNNHVLIDHNGILIGDYGIAPYFSISSLGEIDFRSGNNTYFLMNNGGISLFNNNYFLNIGNDGKIQINSNLTELSGKIIVDTANGTFYPYSGVKKLIVDSIVNLSTNAWTSIKFQWVSSNGRRGDSLFVWPVENDSSKIVVKKEGIYSVEYNVGFKNGGGSAINNVSVGFRVLKNNSEQSCLNGGSFKQSFSSNDGELISVGSTINCNEGDTIKFQYYTTNSAIKILAPVDIFDNDRGITFIIKEFK